MQWLIKDNNSLHNQLIEELKLRIFLDFYRSGDKIPSVRALAEEAGVNPNTMQKALVELENSGLIYTKGTNGRYVAHSKVLINQAKSHMKNQIVDNFITDIQKLGIDNQIIINQLLERLG